MAEVKMNDPVADQLRAQYPSNSLSQKVKPQEPQREKVKPVVKGGAVLQKKNLGEKVKDMFSLGDIKDIREYAVKQVIIPGIKTGVLALVEMALFGQVSRRSGFYGGQKTNYSYISSSPQRVDIGRPTISQKDRASHNFQNIIFATYQDAEDVVSTLIDLVDRYGSATVADFYDAAQIEADWAAQDWGWTSFQKLEPRRIREGYIIDMQPPVYLKGR